MILPEALFSLQERERTPHEELALAVIRQAAADYRDFRVLHCMYPHNTYITGELEKLEEFFRSDWFTILTPGSRLTGSGLLRELDRDI